MAFSPFYRYSLSRMFNGSADSWQPLILTASKLRVRATWSGHPQKST
jgi:hypothetical protein